MRGRINVKYAAVLAVVTALSCGATGTAHAAGTFKGTFGDVHFKAKKRVLGCNYNRSLALFIVSGTQVLKHGRFQRGASASGMGPDPLTGFKRGKVSGTLAATSLTPIPPGAPIAVAATFSAKCTIQ